MSQDEQLLAQMAEAAVEEVKAPVNPAASSLDEQLREQLLGGSGGHAGSLSGTKRPRESAADTNSEEDYHDHSRDAGRGVPVASEWGGQRTRKIRKAKENPQLTAAAQRNEEYIYGNYDKYYGYRTIISDARVAALMERTELLEGKHWLDVGCNNGQLTSVLATRTRAASVVGIDIDDRLIARATEIYNTAYSVQVPVDADDVPLSCADQPLPDVPPQPSMKFVTANIVNPRHNIPLPTSGAFDVILCLSVTKWIHLNFGDDGLRAALLRMYDLLAPGGLLVLEPQPWKSYKKTATKISDKAFLARRLTIKMRPDGFDAHLARLGFERVEQLIQSGARKEDKGFARDLVLYRKRVDGAATTGAAGGEGGTAGTGAGMPMTHGA